MTPGEAGGRPSPDTVDQAIRGRSGVDQGEIRDLPGCIRGCGAQGIALTLRSECGILRAMLGINSYRSVRSAVQQCVEAVLCTALALIPPWLALKYALWVECGATVECLALLAN